MKYKLLRGKRPCLHDIVITHDEDIVFRGRFSTQQDRRLKSNDVRMIEAIKISIESLNEKK